MRPPRRRYSRVSGVAKMRPRSQAARAAASTSSMEAPAAATSAAAMAARPRAAETRPLSTTRTGMPAVNCSAARVADCRVALILEEMQTTTMPSAPLETRRANACWKRPTEGAAVSGSTEPVVRRRQNSSPLSSSRSTNSSSPKRMVRGTTSMRCWARASSGRSQEESVTMRIISPSGSE